MNILSEEIKVIGNIYENPELLDDNTRICECGGTDFDTREDGVYKCKECGKEIHE